MASQTSGGISDLMFTMGARIDESSVSDAMKTLGDLKSKMSTSTFSANGSGGSTSSQDIADTKFAEAQQYVAQLDAAYEASEQQRLAAIQAQSDANEAAFAAMQQHVAQLDAAQEASEQQRLAAEQALADAAETEFAAMLQHVAQLDAAEEAAEQQRLSAVKAEIDAIEGDMTRALRRTLNIEDQINHDYQRRLQAIDAIQGATAQQTAELRLQAAAVRDAATQTAINAGQIGGIGGAGLTGNRIQEIGRGIEDFTVGFSMAKTNIEGVAMGLRGSANNAAQLAASFNPVVGASVAIGASLATVIVPMVARWLWDTKALAEAQDAWNDKLKESGKLQQDVANNLAKTQAIIINDASQPEASRGQALLSQIQQMEHGLTENDQLLRFKQLELQRAKDTEEQAKNDLRMAKDAASTNAAAAIGGGIGMPGGMVVRPGTSSAEDEKAAADAKKAFDLAEVARKRAEKEVSDAEAAVITSEETISEVKKRNAEDIANAQKRLHDREFRDRSDKLSDIDRKETEFAIARAKKDLDTQRDNIRLMNLSPENKQSLIDKEEFIYERKVEKAKVERDKKNDNIESQINEDSLTERASKFAEINRKYDKKHDEIADSEMDGLEKEALKQKNRDNRNAALDKQDAINRLDNELSANADQQDALKEKIDLAGNANTSTAAMSVGSQAAESAIAKALSGSASVESTDKKQLKVLEKIEKKIGKEKQRIASIT